MVERRARIDFNRCKNDNWGDHPHFFIFLWIETKDARFVWIVVAAPRDKSESTLPFQGRWPSCWLFEWVEWTEFPYVDVDWLESEEAKSNGIDEEKRIILIILNSLLGF